MSMRIVSLAPSNTEILYALGVEDQVVAVTRFCDYPRAAQAKEKVGSWIATEPEKLEALEPDLILTSYFMPEPLRKWRGPGQVLHYEPKTLWDVFESIRSIGQAVGATDRAEAVVRTMKEGFDAIRSRARNRSVRVYMEEWMTPPMAAGNWVPELAAVAGGEEVVGEIGQPSREFSFAALALADPELVICHWCGWGTRTDPKRILEREGWRELRAVREGRVMFLDDSLINRPGPRLVQGAAALQAAFHQFAETP